MYTSLIVICSDAFLQNVLIIRKGYVHLIRCLLQSAVSVSPPLCLNQVFNQAAFQAKSARELTDALADFMDCSIVIPPTEIQNETMLASIISFQKKLLQDRFQSSNSTMRQDSKTRRGECSKTHSQIQHQSEEFGFYVKHTGWICRLLLM